MNIYYKLNPFHAFWRDKKKIKEIYFNYLITIIFIKSFLILIIFIIKFLLKIKI
jgi:hypothetical protein